MSEITIEADDIGVESISLSQLFEKKLTIPEYQRPYVWKKNEIDKLLAQIKIYNEQKSDNYPMFYLGSIVLHKDEKFNLNIIDGQQRITTLSIISFIKNQIDFGIVFTNLTSQSTIQDNYKYLSSLHNALIDIDFNSINVTVITTKSQDNAYNFFETLNTGGKRLSGIDIIKAHHLRSFSSFEINHYAKMWEQNQRYIEEAVPLLLKARKWNLLNFDPIPSRRGGLVEWKNVITDEFSVKTLKDNQDICYASWKENGRTFERPGNKYSIRQPLSDGKNFINYLISYADLYKDLFTENKGRSAFYQKFNLEVINVINGTIDLKPIYQLALVCYVSRFGDDKLEQISLWLFRYIYSLRVSVKNRIQEVTAIKHCVQEKKIIEHIITFHGGEEVLKWLKSHKYEANSENLEGKVKGRFVAQIKSFFDLNLKKDDISDLDIQLTQYLNKRNT